MAKKKKVQEVVTVTVAEAKPTEATPKKERVSKRPYIDFVKEHCEIGDCTGKELLALILEKYSTVTKSGAQTFITDLKNIKYCHFKPRAVVQQENGKLIFQDKVVEVPVEAVPVEEEHNEQPAE